MDFMVNNLGNIYLPIEGWKTGHLGRPNFF